MSGEGVTKLKPDKVSIRFSNYWLMFGISLLPWIMMFVTFSWIANDRGYGSFTDINKDLDDFLWIMILGLIFTSMGITATSYYASTLPSFLDDLDAIMIKDETKETETASEQVDPVPKTDKKNEHWYQSFLNDTDSFAWFRLYFIPLSVISLVIHYIVYGHLVVDAFGWTVYMLTIIVMLWSNIVVGSWLIWFIVAQYLHIYRFHNDDGGHYIGIKGDHRRFWYRFLPTTVKPKKIKVDVFNVDELGGLSPLASMNMMGAFLMGLVASVLIPLVIIVDTLIAIILLPIIFLGIAFGYLVGISSLRDAIRMEKKKLLGKINSELSDIATKIIGKEGENQNSLDIKEMADLNKRFEILDQIGKRIISLPESPRSLSATIRVLSAGILPLISFISIDQVGIFV